MMVRFATVCDHDGCEARSEEYTTWPTCRICESHVCPTHTVPHTLREADGDASSDPPRYHLVAGTHTVVCTDCAAQKDVDQCDRCGEYAPLQVIQESPQTRWEPAVYMAVCETCDPSYDADAAREAAAEAKLDGIRNGDYDS